MRIPHLPALLFTVVCIAGSALAAPSATSPSPLLQQGNARIVLVGDSITGQSRNHPGGYAHQMDWALQQVYAGCTPNIVALGGSGQGVKAWLNTERRSRAEAFPLDVKDIDVKAALNQPADVLIVMLGMNDVLAPYVADDSASLQQWSARYRELVLSLQVRLHPKITAVATATLCTEDEQSPKNVMIGKLNKQLQALASELHWVILPAHESMFGILNQGRVLKPDFHVTNDYVHPNETGHLAIAIAMLRGLGEEQAARVLEEKKVASLMKPAAEMLPLSYTAFHNTSDGGDCITGENVSFPLQFFYFIAPRETPMRVTPKLRIADDSHAHLPAKRMSSGMLTLKHYENKPQPRLNAVELTIENADQTVHREIPIPAPWIVTTGVFRKPWTEPQLANAALFNGPMEEAIEQGHPLAPQVDPSLADAPHWKTYFATVDFTGGNDPDSVDFAAVSHARNFETGYGARWIRSDRDRALNLEVSTQVFAGTLFLRVWLDGKIVYSGLLTAEPGKKKSVPAKLSAGWHSLVFALDHTAWQMQCKVHLAGMDDDSLDDLRYSITPQAGP